MMMKQLAVLIVGGTAGTLARYWLSGAVYQWAGTGFPYGTLIVNLAGCWLIGLFTGLAEDKFLFSPEMRLMLMVGFCGAFTTFSTFIYESDALIRDGETLRALMNILISVTAGFMMFRWGIWVADMI